MNKEHSKETTRPECKVIDGIYIGTLMSPADVAKALAGRGEVAPGISKRWNLCGDIDPKMFDALNACGHPQQHHERLSAFGGEDGVRYAVISHQAGSFQHRFLAPLFDPKVAACIKAIAHGDALGYLLGGEGHMAAVWKSHFSVRDLMPVLPLCTEAPEGSEERVLEEFFNTALELKNPERIPSMIEGVAVRLASVSAISPDELIEKVDGWRGLQDLVRPH